MSRKETARRYVVFLIGLFIYSFGVSFVTRSNLGTLPISSIPYVLSLDLPMTLGQFIIICSLLLFILQIVVLGKNFEKTSLLQIPAAILFGGFIDLTMFLLQDFAPASYVTRGGFLLVGCVIVAFGMYLEVIADVAMLPGESFVKSISARLKKDFGATKVCFDAAMVIIAGILSFVFFHKLDGVGVGTVVAALIVGLIVKWFGKVFEKFSKTLFGERKKLHAKRDKAKMKAEKSAGVTLAEAIEMTYTGTKEESKAEKSEAKLEMNSADKITITIARECGSGGRNIGKLVAKQLGINYYDADLMEMTAKMMGKKTDIIEKSNQKLTNSFLFDLYLQCNAYAAGEHSMMEDVFETEKEIIQELADRESCVIVGRLGNFILQDHPNAFHVFLRADMEDKMEHIMKRDGRNETEALHKIKKVERERREHCQLMTGKEWGNKKYYDMTLNTSKYTEQEVADHIIGLCSKKER